MGNIIKTPQGSYYAVIFTSKRTVGDKGYKQTADELMQIVSEQEGFLGAESVRNEEGFGMTISYWDSMDSINKWKNNQPHLRAKDNGTKLWYSEYMLRICKVERDHYFISNEESTDNL